VLFRPITAAVPAYHRHRPEQTTLYSILAEHYPRFVQEIEQSGGYLHMLFLDGAYTFSGNRPTFHRARRSVGEEQNDLLDTLSRRIVRVLERRGLLIADPEHPYLDLEPGSSLDHLQAASITYCIAIGPHAGRKALNLA
jgi:hypothetical protein